MADVVPMAPERRERVPLGPHAETLKPQRALAPSLASDEPESVESSFVAPGVDRRELRKLKRGEYRVALRVDLHGLNAEEALARMNRFIDSSRHARHRAVCIVHGRGLHSKDGVAVLKTRVRASLRANRAVLAFADAPAADGGAGAVYVLLRK
jgi:DNA-nicking Smr family endonuclease